MSKGVKYFEMLKYDAIKSRYIRKNKIIIDNNFYLVLNRIF